jgi:hypothetical protein
MPTFAVVVADGCAVCSAGSAVAQEANRLTQAIAASSTAIVLPFDGLTDVASRRDVLTLDAIE